MGARTEADADRAYDKKDYKAAVYQYAKSIQFDKDHDMRHAKVAERLAALHTSLGHEDFCTTLGGSLDDAEERSADLKAGDDLTAADETKIQVEEHTVGMLTELNQMACRGSTAPKLDQQSLLRFISEVVYPAYRYVPSNEQ